MQTSIETWIIYHVDPDHEDPHELERQLLNGGLTAILAEHWDCSNSHHPEPGERLTEYAKLKSDDEFPFASSHYRPGDWQVTRVERYQPELPGASKREIVLCYCKFAPLPVEQQPEWRELGRVQVPEAAMV